jgi:hypothetical protein
MLSPAVASQRAGGRRRGVWRRRPGAHPLLPQRAHAPGELPGHHLCFRQLLAGRRAAPVGDCQRTLLRHHRGTLRAPQHDAPRLRPRGSLFKLLAALAETSVFLFIGSSLFLDQQELGTWGLLPFLVSAGGRAGAGAAAAARRRSSAPVGLHVEGQLHSQACVHMLSER